MKKVIFCLMFLVLIFVSCSKFDNGGLKSKAEKRIEASWKLENYFRNGNDETSTLLISVYEETYASNIYSRSYKDKNGDTFSEVGKYEFDSDKNLKISDVSSITDFSGTHSTLSASAYTILKLKKDEYWYSFENGGDVHEFHFVKK